MKTKTVALFALAAFSLATFAADVNGGFRKKKPGSKPNGGFIELVNTGKVIQVVNDRAACPAAALAFSLDVAQRTFHFPFVATNASVSGKLDDRVAARVVFVSRGNQPRLLCAPEEGWSEVNVPALLIDSPSETVANKRIASELVRALCYALGCGNSSVKPCVMDEVDSLGRLDSLTPVLSPETMGKTVVTARRRGCRPRQFTSYRKACEEGWAPAPTNDVQKAIWDKVHQMPAAPLKIKPETKKVAE